MITIKIIKLFKETTVYPRTTQFSFTQLKMILESTLPFLKNKAENGLVSTVLIHDIQCIQVFFANHKSTIGRLNIPFSLGWLCGRFTSTPNPNMAVAPKRVGLLWDGVASLTSNLRMMQRRQIAPRRAGPSKRSGKFAWATFSPRNKQCCLKRI